MKPPEYRCGLGPLPSLTYGDRENPPRPDRGAVDHLYDLIEVLGAQVVVARVRRKEDSGDYLLLVGAIGDGYRTNAHVLDPADPVPALAEVVADLKDPGRG